MRALPRRTKAQKQPDLLELEFQKKTTRIRIKCPSKSITEKFLPVCCSVCRTVTTNFLPLCVLISIQCLCLTQEILRFASFEFRGTDEKLGKCGFQVRFIPARREISNLLVLFAHQYIFFLFHHRLQIALPDFHIELCFSTLDWLLCVRYEVQAVC